MAPLQPAPSDPDTVGLIGINARLVNATAAAIAFATVGLVGAPLAMRATFDPYAGGPHLIFAFEAAVIGAPAPWSAASFSALRRTSVRKSIYRASSLSAIPYLSPFCSDAFFWALEKRAS
jgi:branched-subunit amino acid ABC-type transport system permease component